MKIPADLLDYLSALKDLKAWLILIILVLTAVIRKLFKVIIKTHDRETHRLFILLKRNVKDDAQCDSGKKMTSEVTQTKNEPPSKKKTLNHPKK